MQEDVLNLQVGATLQLQAVNEPDAPRYQVRTIGYLPGETLIVSTPSEGGKDVPVRKGQTFNVRMLRGNSVMGFSSYVVQSAATPFPHLHLNYPNKVESIVVRNAQRVMSDLMGAAKNMVTGGSDDHLPVSILDVSLSGAKVASGAPLGERGENLQLSFEVNVLGKKEKIVTLGAIRNVGERQGASGQSQYTYGLEFTSINRFQQVLLHGWVLEQMTSEDPAA